MDVASVRDPLDEAEAMMLDKAGAVAPQASSAGLAEIVERVRRKRNLAS